MANGGRIDYTLGFKVDTSSLKKIDEVLGKLNSVTSKDLMASGQARTWADAVKQINQAQAAVDKFGAALKKAYNPTLGTFSIDAFNTSLKRSETNVKSIYQGMSKFGAVGKNAFMNLSTSVLKSNTNLEKTATVLDKIGSALTRSIKWQVSGMAIQKMMGSVNEAFGYVKALDTSLNNIQIVTQKSADEMDRFAVRANKAAQAMGAATKSYTDAALIFYQEGLNTKDAEVLGDLTVKISNVTGESAEQVSQNVTAVVNGYQIAYQDAEQTMDKLAAVAANSASNLNELSTAMSKTAASANMVGMDVDRLTAALSTTISVTRQAPETVGTAYKTILARLGDLKIDGEDEDGYSLGLVSKQLKDLGIDILDANNEMRDMGDVITEIGEKWQTWDRGTQQAAAIAMAGKRQYTMLTALFDNWDRYNSMLDVSGDSLGTLQQQQDTYMESTAAHIQTMKTAFENVFDSFLDTDTIEGTTDAITTMANGMAKFIDAIGGGNTVLLSLGSIAMMVFSRQIATGINTTINNFKKLKIEEENVKNLTEYVGEQIKSLTEAGSSNNEIAVFEKWESVLTNIKYLANEDRVEIQKLLEQLSSSTQQFNTLSEQKQRFMTSQSNTRNLASYYNEQGLVSRMGMAEFTSSIESGNGGGALNSISFGLDSTKQKANELLQSLNSLNKASSLSSMVNGIDTVRKAWSDLSTAEKIALTGSVTNSKAMTVQIKKLATLAKAEENASKALRTGAKATDELTKQTAEMRSALRSAAADGLKNLTSTFEKSFEELPGLIARSTNEIKVLLDTTKALNQALNNVNNIKIGQGFVKGIGAIGSFAMGLSQLKNIGDILSNQELSGFDKLLETTISLSFAIPMITAGLSTFGNALKTVSSLSSFQAIQTQTLNALEAERNALIAIGNTTEAARVATTIGSIGANKLKTAADLKLMATEARLTTLQGILAAITSVASGEMTALAASEYIASTVSGVLAAAIGKVSAALAIMKAGIISMPGVGWILGIATAIGAVVAAVKIAQAQTEKYEASLASASAAAIESVDNAINAFNELGNTIDDLKSKRDAIDELTQGTQEWTHAVLENNAAALKLINTYDLMPDDYITEGGVVEIRDTGYDKMQRIASKRIEVAQASQYITTKKENNYNDSKAWKELTKEIKQNQQLNSYKMDLKEGVIETKPSEAEKAYYNSALSLAQKIDDSLGTNYASQLEGRNVTEQQLEKLTELSAQIEANTAESNVGYENLVRQKLSQNESFNKMSKEAQDEYVKDWIQNHANYDITQLEGSYQKIGAAKDGKHEYKVNYGAYEDILKDYIIDYAQADVAGLSNIKFNGKEITYNYSGGAEGTKEGSIPIDQDSLNQIIAAIQELDSNIDNNKYIDNSEWEQKAKINQAKEKDKSWTEQAVEKYNTIYGQSGMSSSAKEQMDKQKDSIIDYYKKEFIDEEANQQLTENTINQAAIWENIDEDKIEEYSKYLQENVKALKDDANAAKQVAADNMKLNESIKDLQSNWESYNNALSKKPENRTADEVANITQYKKALEGLISVPLDEMSDGFAESNKVLELMGKIADGDLDKINELRKAAAQDIVTNIGIQDKEVQSELNEIINGIDLDNLEIGATLDSTGLTDALNDMVTQGKISAEELQRILNALGWDPKVTYEDIPIEEQTDAEIENLVKSGITSNIPGMPESARQQMTSSLVSQARLSGKVRVPIINGKGTKYNGSGKTAANVNANKGSGGGKGGSGSKGEKKSKKKFGEDTNPYKKQEDAIKKLSKQYDTLNDASNKYIGKRKIDGLKEQTNLLEKQNTQLNKELVILNKIAKAEQKTGKKKYGLKFDKDTGKISNYDTIVEKERRRYNQAVDKYNKSGRGEKAQETMEKAEKRWEEFTSFLDNYQSEVEDKYTEIHEQIAENFKTELENNLSKIDAYVSIHADYDDFNKGFKDFMTEISGMMSNEVFKNIFGSSVNREAALAKYGLASDVNRQSVYSAYNLSAKKALQGLKAIDKYGYSVDYWNDEEKAKEDLKSQISSLQELWTERIEDYTKAMEAYTNSIEKANEELKHQMEIYDAIEGQYKHDANIISTLYGDKASKYLEKVNKQQIANNKAAIESAKAEYDFYKKQYENIKKEYKNATSETAKDNMKAELDAVESMLTDTMNKINSLIESSCETIINEYKRTIETIVIELNEKFMGGLDLDTLEDEFSSIIDVDGIFLDEPNRIFGIQELTSKWQDAINQTQNVEIQQKLNDLMRDQLKILEEKGKLTQYDLDRAEKEYELALKQIALAEAQQNKSKMRLVRDANGNYTYRFTADQNEISKAQQEVNKAQNNLYNLDAKQYQDSMSDVMKYYKNMVDRLAQIAENDTMGDEEKTAKQEEIIQRYGKAIQDILGVFGSAGSNLAESAAMYGLDILDITKLNNLDNSSVMDFINQLSGGEDLQTLLKIAIKDVNTAIAERDANLSKIGLDDTSSYLQDIINGNDEFASFLKSDVLSDTQKIIATQEKSIQNAQDAWKEAKDQWDKWSNQFDAFEQLMREADDILSKIAGDTKASYSKAKQNDTKIQNGDVASAKSKTAVYSSINGYGDSKKKTGVITKGSEVKVISHKNGHVLIEDANGNKGWVSEEDFKKNFKGFDTGGYTGSWSNGDKDGRLAMLHQKELVLNKDDTKNILDTVTTIRDVMQMNNFDSSSIYSAIKGANNSGIAQDIQQQVSINANFPNVSTANEIEKALNNLMNSASQRVMQR